MPQPRCNQSSRAPAATVGSDEEVSLVARVVDAPGLDEGAEGGVDGVSEAAAAAVGGVRVDPAGAGPVALHRGADGGHVRYLAALLQPGNSVFMRSQAC